MAAPILATKLFIPPPRRKAVLRPRLIERLDAGARLSLISAPAGFGKTTLVSEWVASRTQHAPGLRAAWLSLDEGDNDPARFLTYLISALQIVAPETGAGLLGVLQSPQPPSTEIVLTTLINELNRHPGHFVLVLDDYHAIDSRPVDKALTFLIEHLPPQMHLVIATREDPPLPLARLRARGALNELRAADLRFTPAEAAEFLNQVMGLKLSGEDIAALEARTEGWIAGLQLAAISMQGHGDTGAFIQSFTGSHHFVMDYLLEEVLHQQPAGVQAFLLRTSILDRLCGPLCDAVLGVSPGEPPGGTPRSGQDTLEYLERANLFIVPLDNERRWYRYHHLFRDLLRQRLERSLAASPAEPLIYELHLRASQWYEDNGLDLEAFRHAGAAQDIERAERLIEGRGIPLHFRGAATAVLDWLGSLPPEVMDARPSLWWRYAGLMLINGQTTGVEEKLQAAEAALHAQGQGGAADEKDRNLLGQIAAARATLALTRYDKDTMLSESQRALEYLHPSSLSSRGNAYWTMGYALLLGGDRPAARRALAEGAAISQAAGAVFTYILTTIGLGNVQEADNQLHQAAQTYRHVLELTGDQPLQIIHEAHLGLARILYEWNDLEAAEQHGRHSLHLAQQYDRVIDRFILCEVFLARIRSALGDVSGASAILAQAAFTARQQNFVHRIPEVAAAQVVVLLRQGSLGAAAHLAQAHNLPLSQARVSLAHGDAPAALAVLAAWRRQVEALGLEDERLRALVLEAVAHQAHGETDQAEALLGDALALAEPGGFIRIFVDEGRPAAELLTRLQARGGGMQAYIQKLLAAFEQPEVVQPASAGAQSLVEPLSPRELQVLQLIARGLSNQQISAQLFLALSTVKGHNQVLFSKLHVQSRTEAVARARELGLL